jgi:hypothetical protein
MAAEAQMAAMMMPRVAATTGGHAELLVNHLGKGGVALTVATAAFALKARVFDTPRAKFGRRFYRTWYRWAFKTRAFYRLGY